MIAFFKILNDLIIFQRIEILKFHDTHHIFTEFVLYYEYIYIFNVCFIPLFITLKVQQRENIRLKIYYLNLLKHIKTIQIL